MMDLHESLYCHFTSISASLHHEMMMFDAALSLSSIGYILNLPPLPNMYCAQNRPATRPNTTQSRSELPPRRLLPCTPPAASPATYKPGTALASLTHSPLTVVSRPPMQ